MKGIMYVIGGGFAGFMVFAAGYFDPVLNSFYVPVIGAFMIWICPLWLTLDRLKKGDCMIYFNPPIKNKPAFEFLYRIGERRIVYGTRLPGTGFSKIKNLGLVLEMGGKSVYRHGDKPVQMVLQDLAHTPDPRFYNFTKWLTDIGFIDFDGVQDVLNGKNPELMITVWNNIVEYPKQEPVDILVENIKKMEPVDVKKYNKEMKKEQKKPIWTKEGAVEDLHKDIDKLIIWKNRRKKKDDN